MPEPAQDQPTPGVVGFRIRDLVGLVVGYSLAAFLIRSFLPRLDGARPVEWAACGVFYAWLGLVLSGPFVLLLDRRGRPAPTEIASTHPPGAYSGEEYAWIGMGGYFLAITLLVAPALNRETPWGAIGIVGWLGVTILVGWSIVGGDRNRDAPGRRWTRAAARWLVFTWPVAWLFLFLLARGL